METKKNGSPTNWVARIPRRVVIHRMETADCLESRIFWAMVLWSLCGPQRCTQVVIKDRKGFIQKDASGKPIPAGQKDLLELLGLASGMKGHLSRAIQRLEEKQSIRIQKKVISIEENPPEVSPKDPNAVASTGNWNIAGVVASIGNFPTDPVARTEAIRWVESLSTEWKNNLKTLKTSYRKLVVQGCRERSILIGLEEKKRRRAITPHPSACLPVSDVVESATGTGRQAVEGDNQKLISTEPVKLEIPTEKPEAPPSPEVRDKIRSHLMRTFPRIRYIIEPETLDDCARLLGDDAGFAEFQHETNNLAVYPPDHDRAPKSWRYFPKVAARIAETRLQWSTSRAKAPPGDEEHWAVKLRREMEEKGLK